MDEEYEELDSMSLVDKIWFTTSWAADEEIT